MDVGEFVKTDITITPAENGSYLVRVGRGPQYEGEYPRLACFTNYSDLLNFLCTEYNAANKPMTGNDQPA